MYYYRYEAWISNHDREGDRWFSSAFMVALPTDQIKMECDLMWSDNPIIRGSGFKPIPPRGRLTQTYILEEREESWIWVSIPFHVTITLIVFE